LVLWYYSIIVQYISISLSRCSYSDRGCLLTEFS